MHTISTPYCALYKRAESSVSLLGRVQDALWSLEGNDGVKELTRLGGIIRDDGQ